MSESDFGSAELSYPRLDVQNGAAFRKSVKDRGGIARARHIRLELTEG